MNGRIVAHLPHSFAAFLLAIAFLGCHRDPDSSMRATPNGSLSPLASSPAPSAESSAVAVPAASSPPPRSKTTDALIQYDTYHNSRFAFAIGYPDIYDSRQESDNDDGITLKSADGEHTLKIWGEDTIALRLTMGLRTSGKILLKEAIKRIGPVRESYATEDYYKVVYTGRAGAELNHEACFLLGAVHCFTLGYPVREKHAHQAIIRRMTQDLTGKFDGTEKAAPRN